MYNELEVEVVENHAHLKAFIVNVFENEVKVRFEKNWLPKSRFPFNVVKLPPQRTEKKFEQDEEVEVYSKLSDVENAYGWQKAVVQHIIADGSYIVRNQNFKYETIEKNCVRSPNNNPPLNTTSLLKMEIEVPQSLKVYAMKDGVHDEFKKLVNAERCIYIPKKGVIRIISTAGEKTKRLVLMGKDIHFRHLNTKLQNEAEDHSNNCYTEEFEILEHLMGLAIGKHGSNINNARKIKDVVKVQLIKNTTRFIVSGKTKEAVKAARNMLEYTQKRIDVPNNIAEKIQPEMINEIIEKSDLIRIEMGDDDLIQENNVVPFLLVGTANSITDAEVIFRFQITLLSQDDNKQDMTRKSNEPQNISCYSEKFAAKQKLMGLIIGKQGARIKVAEKMDDIVKIEVKNRTGVIEIHGNTEEAVKNAREYFELDEETINVANPDVGKVVGKGGAVIREIERSSGAMRIYIDKATEKSDVVLIGIIGSRKNIESAKQLIKNRVNF